MGPRLVLVPRDDAAGGTALGLADWPPEQLWLHPDFGAFMARHRALEVALDEALGALPPGLFEGPLGCATAQNVVSLRRAGQRDRAWRLAARLYLAAEARDPNAGPAQRHFDLAVSALRLAGEAHDCLIGTMEAVAQIGLLAERCDDGILDYPGLAMSSQTLAACMRRRQRSLVAGVLPYLNIEPGSPVAAERLMRRAPVT
jgi:hypothetical protein